METTKPTIKATELDGNVFTLLGASRRALVRLGLKALADEMSERVIKSSSYDESLQIMMEYVDFE